MWDKYQEARLQELRAELAPIVSKDDDQISDKEYSRLRTINKEVASLLRDQQNYQKALSMSSYAAPSEHGITGNPGDFDNGTPGYGTGVQWKSFGLPSGAPQVAPPTLDISAEQVKSLFDAAKAGAPYKVQLGQKDFASSMRLKTAGAPLTESGLNNQLPAIQVPGQYGAYGKP